MTSRLAIDEQMHLTDGNVFDRPLDAILGKVVTDGEGLPVFRRAQGRERWSDGVCGAFRLPEG